MFEPRSLAGRLLLAALALSPATLGQAPARVALPADRAAGAGAVTDAELRDWLGTLASPEFGGRGTGQDGFRRAAEYVAAHFRELGLEPGGEDGSYLQVVPWIETELSVEASALTLQRGDETLWRAAPGVLRGQASQDEDSSGPLCFALTARPDGADLEGLELEGMAVIVVPEAGVFAAGDADDGRGRRNLLRSAQQIRGRVTQAGGRLLAIADDAIAAVAGDFAPTSAPDRRGGGPAAAARGRSPVLTAIDRSALAAAWRAAGLGDERPTAPARVALPAVSASLRLDVETRQAPAWNVLAVLRGSDPDLRDEYVGVGSHLDHLGRRGGLVFPGADDDASGSTGLMAIAQMFAKNPERPRRSLLFMAFCGEEDGLIGSAYFAAHPTVPLANLVAELQCDMIGRNEEKDGETAAENLNSLHLVGSQKLSRDLHALCLRLNEDRAQFALEWDEEGVFYRSDHWNFAREGVPIAFFFTGFHPDYHKPSDTADKIDYAKLGRIATYVFDIAFELAQAEDRPMVDAERWEALARKGRQDPAAPVRR
jgi:hypothetical protein